MSGWWTVLVILGGAGCFSKGGQHSQTKAASNPEAARQVAVPKPQDLILAPQGGSDRVDQEIRNLQSLIQRHQNHAANLEKLGWMFVMKARVSFDPGYYKLAEGCADALEAGGSHDAEAMLLRGHVLQNLHHFKQAEPIALELSRERGFSTDFGLLGDVLMEQGRLAEAVPAYQRMMDLKPDLHAYARAAHLRWLKGDLQGALEAMHMAVRASSPRDSESAAWVITRFALYQWQAGHDAEAEASCQEALALQHDYPPALLLRGRLALAQGRTSEAADLLEQAARLNPLPEYEWTLLEAWHAMQDAERAKKLEARLRQKGAVTDPRTYSLFLSTSKSEPALAIRLADKELHERQDVFTYDALAWAQAAAGKWEDATVNLEKALAEGTQDARLFFHAAAIYARTEEPRKARTYAEKALGLQALLLPCERAQLGVIQKSLSAMLVAASAPKTR